MDFKIENMFTAHQMSFVTKDVLYGIMDNVAASARNHWIKLAKEDTSHLRTDYLRAIQPVDIGKNTWTIALVGEIAHLLELGDGPLDMRDTLLGPNVPVVPPGERGKHAAVNGGYYRPIPFRHTGPSSGKVVGSAMGAAYTGMLGAQGARKLGQTIKKAAKQLSASKTSPTMVYGSQTKGGKKVWQYAGEKRTWGDRLKAGYAPKLKAHHKTDIYAGMVRMEKTYEKATQSQYMTFRTISTNVTDGWIRKPISARNYADKVNAYIEKMLPRAIGAFIAEAIRVK